MDACVTLNPNIDDWPYMDVQEKHNENGSWFPWCHICKLQSILLISISPKDKNMVAIYGQDEQIKSSKGYPPFPR